MRYKSIVSKILILGLILNLNVKNIGVYGEDYMSSNSSNTVEQVKTQKNTLDFLKSIPAIDLSPLNDFTYINVDAFFNNNKSGLKKITSMEEFNKLSKEDQRNYMVLYTFNKNLNFRDPKKVSEDSGILSFEINKYLSIGKAPDVQTYFEGNFKLDNISNALEKNGYTKEVDKNKNIFISPNGKKDLSPTNLQKTNPNFIFGGLLGQTYNVLVYDNILYFASNGKKIDSLLWALKEGEKASSIYNRGILKDSMEDLNKKEYSKNDNIYKIYSTFIDKNAFQMNKKVDYKDEYTGNIPMFNEIIITDSILEDSFYLNIYLSYQDENSAKTIKEVLDKRIVKEKLKNPQFKDLNHLTQKYDTSNIKINTLNSNNKVVSIEIKCKSKNGKIDLLSSPSDTIFQSLLKLDLIWLR